MFFIVIAHVHPFRDFGTYGNHVYFVLDTIGQFDVPFFFVTSGYFLAMTVNADTVISHVTGSIRKLGSIYLFGTLLYLSATAGIALLQGVQVTNALVARRLGDISPVGLLYYGNAVAVPLWFLTALLFSICFVSLFIVFGKTRYLLPVATMAHILGLLGTNYQMITDVPFLTRDALFFGFFYVALGFRLRSVNWTPNDNRSRVYLGAAGVLMLFQFLEQYAIGYLIRDHALRQEIYTTEYTVATIFFVLALFAYALSNPEWGKDTILPTVGRYAVGIYLVHVPLFRVFQAMNRVWGTAIRVDLTTTFLWHLLMTPLVYVLSLAVYLFMARMGVIEIGGSHIPWLDRIRAHGSSSTSNGSSTAD